MNKTSYEKEGLNSLNELFEKLIVCSEKQDKEGTLRIVSSLNDEEKDYLYTWATEQGKLDKVAGIVVKAEMDKKAFDINCRFKKTLCEALVQNGYCLEGDPDVYNSDSFPFTDNKYINGEVIFDTRKVQLKARDAENRKYEKTIDYSSVGDLIESINHFRKDIEETFEKPEVAEEVVKEEPFDILGDKNFLKEIGADWVTDLIKKKADDGNSQDGYTLEEGNDYYQIFKNNEKGTFRIWNIDGNKWEDTQEYSDIATAEKEIENLAEGLPEKLTTIGWDLELFYDDENQLTSLEYLTGIDDETAKIVEQVASKIESWFVEFGYTDYFSYIREEGHVGGTLGGTAWVTEDQLEDCHDNAEGWSTMKGNFEFPNGLNFGKVKEGVFIQAKLTPYFDLQNIDYPQGDKSASIKGGLGKKATDSNIIDINDVLDIYSFDDVDDYFVDPTNDDLEVITYDNGDEVKSRITKEEIKKYFSLEDFYWNFDDKGEVTSLTPINKEQPQGGKSASIEGSLEKKAEEFVEVPKSDEEMHKLFERVLGGETLKFNNMEEVFLGESGQKIDEGVLYIYYQGYGSFAKEPTFENFKWILTEIINHD